MGKCPSPHRAQVFVLHLLELCVSVPRTQLHISQHHLENSVVYGLGEVHVQLIHCSLQRKPTESPRYTTKTTK